MVTLAGMSLSMCTKPQQTAEMSASLGNAMEHFTGLSATAHHHPCSLAHSQSVVDTIAFLLPPQSGSIHPVIYYIIAQSTGLCKKAGPRLRDCCRQGQAEVVSNSKNKIHQTWERERKFNPPLEICQW